MTQDQLLQSQAVTSRQGSLGEQFALSFERKRLPEFLHGKIVHFEEREIALGYDILSYETRTSILPDRYIEVKTFRGHPHFYWTENEIAAARKYGEHYYLYLVDVDRVGESDYEPQIIPNPAILFNEGSPWTHQVQQYAFSLNAETNIPHDWDTSTILLGCYNNEQHLRWILGHNLYNVRAQKNSPGAVTLNNPQVRQATHLILYSVSNPRVYMLYRLDPQPYKATKTEMQALGYTNPHAFSYILHPISERLHTFHLDLAPLLREVNHQGDNTYGTPLYLAGIQLRRFMPPVHEPKVTVPEITIATVPVASATGIDPVPHERPSMVAEPEMPYRPSRQGSSWTPEDDTLLITHLQQHTPIAEIAPLLQRSEKAIVRRMGRLRSTNTIPFALYIHYYDNDPAFALHRNKRTT